MKIYITGMAGFLGSHIAEYFLSNGHAVYGSDNLIGGEIKNIQELIGKIEGQKLDRKFEGHDFDFKVINSCDFKKLAEHMKGSNIVYHCAASPHEGLSVFSPNVVNENTYMSTIGALVASVNCKIDKFVFFSSMARYGDLTPPYLESDDCRPVDPYGICKLAAEKQVRTICDVHGIRWSICVPHNIIGTRQKYHDPYRNVCGIMMNMMLQGRQPIIYGDGKQQRCFSPVDDMIDIIARIGMEEQADSTVFNIGPDEGEVTINELARTIHSIMKSKGLTDLELDPQYFPDRPQEVKIALCSSKKIRDFFDFKSKKTLEESLTDMIDYLEINGAKDFDYALELEIVNDKTPKTWERRLF